MIKKEKKATNEFNQEMKSVSLTADAWNRLRKNKMAYASFWIVVVYALIALLAPVLPFYPYAQQNLNHTNLPPSFQKAGDMELVTRKAYFAKVMAKEKRGEYNAEEQAVIASIEERNKTDPEQNRRYLLGTDSLGRDMLSRTVYGGRISMMVGLIGTVTALLIGIVIGSIAGYAGGRIDSFLMRFVDVMYGLPYMLVVIIMMAIVGRNVAILFIAIALVSWLTIGRVVRGQVMSLKNMEFVLAARSMGARPWHIIMHHLIPNTVGIIIVYTALSLPSFIMSESFLSFLGLGISAPLASWGSLISDGVQGMALYPWCLLVPAVVMTVFLFAMNFLGDGARDAFDPQSKNRV